MPLKKAALILAFTALCAGPAWAGNPVVLELFTAQGCERCPDADTLISQLATEDADLIILPCHENTSDEAGGKDKMAQEICTARHNAYEQSLDLYMNITPTAILNGKYPVIGVKEDLLRAAIKMARSIDNLEGLQVSKSKETLDITLPETSLEEPADVFFVALDSAQTLRIMDGENMGLSVPYQGPVKYLFKIFSWNGEYKNKSIPLKAYEAAAYGVIVQQRGTGAILKAAITD